MAASIILQVIHEDALVAVARRIGDDDVLCTALACTAFWRALQASGRWPPGSRLRTREGAMVATPQRLAWAQAAFMGLRGTSPYEASPRRLCILAAGQGAVDTLRFLATTFPMDDEDVWDVDACGAAALEGHLEALRWLRAHGCPWDGSTCRNAAWAGHVDVLRWAIANECPHDVALLLAVAHDKGPRGEAVRTYLLSG